MEGKDVYRSLLQGMHEDYINAFKSTFHVGRNGTLRCTNADIPKFNAFLHRFRSYFAENDVLIPETLNFAVPHFGDIGTINDNKGVLLRIYGMAFLLYTRTCRRLNIPLDPVYTDFVLIEVDPRDDISDPASDMSKNTKQEKN